MAFSDHTGVVSLMAGALVIGHSRAAKCGDEADLGWD